MSGDEKRYRSSNGALTFRHPWDLYVYEQSLRGPQNMPWYTDFERNVKSGFDPYDDFIGGSIAAGVSLAASCARGAVSLASLALDAYEGTRLLREAEPRTIGEKPRGFLRSLSDFLFGRSLLEKGEQRCAAH